MALVSAGFAAAQSSLALPSGVAVTGSAISGKTRLSIRTAKGKRHVLRVTRDATIAPNARPSKLQLIGEIAGTALILTDTYPSRALGMSMCQAGEETFLRVISLRPSGARETFRSKVSSCRDNLELADPGLVWNPQTGTLTIHWLTGPQGKDQQILQIAPDGAVQSQ
jgi:hypothetical protein